MILARQGDHANAVDLARQSADLARRTDYVNSAAATLLALAEVLTLAGDLGHALAITTEALTIYERKGNLVMAQRTRERRHQLEQAAALR